MSLCYRGKVVDELPRSNTSIQAIAQNVEPMALAQLQFYYPTSTRFRPTYILIIEMSLFIVEISVAADVPRSNTSIQAIALYAESIALAQFQHYRPSSTRFRP
jgi:hypothetical protein